MGNGETEHSDTIFVIGVGNEFRNDDGIGIHIARKLSKLNLSHIQITEAVKDGTNLMELWKDKENVIVIDAASTGSEPGMIFRFNASKKALPAQFSRHSSHAFSVAEAIELSRKLSQLPGRLIIYGIEGKDFSNGDHLSETAQRASEYVLDLILQETKPSVQTLIHTR
jgi:hydrogenase maturation protease